MPSQSPKGSKRSVTDSSPPSFNRHLKSNGNASNSQSTPPLHTPSHQSQKSSNRWQAGARIHSRNTYGKGFKTPKISQEQTTSGKEASRTHVSLPRNVSASALKRNVSHVSIKRNR